MAVSRLPKLRSERLLLREMQLSDAPAYFAWASDPQVSTYTYWEVHRDISMTRRAITFAADKLAQGTAVEWGIFLQQGQDPAQFIGTIGLYVLTGCGTADGTADFGYGLGRYWWGKGYATEAAKLLFDSNCPVALGLQTITAQTVEENVQSRRVLEKVGFLRQSPNAINGDAESIEVKGVWYPVLKYLWTRPQEG